MNNQNKILWTVVAILLLYCFFSTCQWKKSKENYDSSKEYAQSLNDTIRHLANDVVAIKEVSVTKEVFDDILKDRDDLKRQLSLVNVKPKNVKSVATIVQYVTMPGRIDTIRDTVPGRAASENRFIDTLTLISNIKQSLFAKDQYLITAHHSNSAFTTTGLSQITIKEKKKWWDRRAYFLIAGAIVGHVLLSK